MKDLDPVVVDLVTRVINFYNPKFILAEDDDEPTKSITLILKMDGRGEYSGHFINRITDHVMFKFQNLEELKREVDRLRALQN